MRTSTRLLLFFLPMLCVLSLHGQIGGLYTYEFLNLSNSARQTALGGTLITVQDDDANLALGNPAVLNHSMHQQLSFSHSFMVAGINHGYASYAHYFEPKQITGHLGVQYIHYGTFDETNELGERIGSFQASEYAITAGAGRQVSERLALGANFRAITSQLAGYSSIGLGLDAAALYADTARNLTGALVFRNMGRQITYYAEGNPEPLPFEIQLGISKRLRYLPFRLSVTYRYLNRWNIRYDDPNAEPSLLFFGEEQPEESRSSIWIDNLFRHFVFSGEFLLGPRENLRLRAGYSHLMRRELALDNFGSLAGFSFGLGVKISRFRIEYGHQAYHLAGGLNHLSISTNIREFKGG
ncbi:type IX secretion system protein PorQ [Phaeodactylibacter luteus]|uniref:Type IX secretion system protein PorQ n=1 Tax=Phaeodactylibacter luteus TaxID=1564516 RepID=A0A5C6S0P2_9BACT|nr:type IX secretion system protein PorQ [Phaeodactylibacter luteus]TXB68396.1 type IX secretion system protein PorQ [Phaeodactylibacter luteus]